MKKSALFLGLVLASGFASADMSIVGSDAKENTTTLRITGKDVGTLAHILSFTSKGTLAAGEIDGSNIRSLSCDTSACTLVVHADILEEKNRDEVLSDPLSKELMSSRERKMAKSLKAGEALVTVPFMAKDGAISNSTADSTMVRAMMDAGYENKAIKVSTINSQGIDLDNGASIPVLSTSLKLESMTLECTSEVATWSSTNKLIETCSFMSIAKSK